MGKIKGFKDYQSLSDWLYEQLRKRYNARARFKKPFRIGFSGGTSPLGLWQRMVWAANDWDYMHIFFVDERAVPPDSELSNYRLLKEKLLAPARINSSQVFPIEGELGAEKAARKYDELLRKELLPNGLDLIVAGIGQDGHIASLFPGAGALKDHSRLAVPVPVAPLAARITITIKTFRLAREVFLILSGEKKRKALSMILDEKVDTLHCPAKAVLELGNSVILTTEFH